MLACPIRLPIFSLFSYEPELGKEIDPGMVMTPFPSSILGRDSNTQPYDCKSNSLTTRPDRYPFWISLCDWLLLWYCKIDKDRLETKVTLAHFLRSLILYSFHINLLALKWAKTTDNESFKIKKSEGVFQEQCSSNMENLKQLN